MSKVFDIRLFGTCLSKVFLTVTGGPYMSKVFLKHNTLKQTEKIAFDSSERAYPRYSTLRNVPVQGI